MYRRSLLELDLKSMGLSFLQILILIIILSCIRAILIVSWLELRRKDANEIYRLWVSVLKCGL